MKFRKPVRYEDDAKMPLYEGTCRGGPWDGQQYAHAKTTFTIAMLDCKPWAQVQPFADESSQDLPLIFGEYRHVAGQWVWHKGSQH